MPDREKVIKALEECVRYTECDKCPYGEMGLCELDLMADAAALLKEQAQIIDRYREADAFLYAHGWRWNSDGRV